MKKLYVITLLLLLVGSGLFAQTNFFKQASPGDPSARVATLKISKKGIYQLDEAGIRNYLKGAPMEFKNNGRSLPIVIPLPDGTTETFNVVESPVLSAVVAADHPDIKTYSGKGLVNNKAVIRISLTSNGLSAIILNVNGSEAVYIEKSAGNIYFNYFAKDAGVPRSSHLKGGTGGQDFKLGTMPLVNPGARVSGVNSAQSTGGILTVFRLAMAADGEFVAVHGGNVVSAFNDIVAYVNRLNALYRNELSVGFTLVSGTNLIYPDATTDPYDNNNQGQMIDQNTITCNNIIGSANYDIGHVIGSFPGTTGGGLAYLQSLCNNSLKGGGASNEGDADALLQSINDKLVFHEFGHQFGMTHSYNSSIPVCTSREPGTSVEPGAGTTVMSYGMICSGDDAIGDDYYPFVIPEGRVLLQFHTVSYQQAVAFMATLTYPPGVVVTNTGNSPPVITMPPGYTIPKSTPFSLTGSATDANNDALTYAWEGTNTGGDAAHPPDATTLANTALPPFSRTYAPAPTATRIFPVIDSILNGSNYARADKLPSVTVAANYNLTVRDNNPAGGGVSFGSVTVNVNGNIGPFLETTNLSASYAGLSTQTITWSVNGTSTATPNVKISLSTDGGYTFPTVLLASTPNDGSQAVTLPNINTTTARIKIEAVGNIFFDISNANFTITPVATTFNIVATSGANGTVTPAGTTSVPSGANQPYTITPNAGYKVANVLVDNVSAGAVTSYTFSNVTATHTISATFSPVAVTTYTITASTGANGTVTPAGVTTVNSGANQPYTITPNAGYAIANVLVDNVSAGAVTSYTFNNVTATHTISATFSPVAVTTYTITASTGGNGTVTPAGVTTVNSGANQPYTITPNAGYAIANVLVDNVSVGAVASYTFSNVTATHTISATFVVTGNVPLVSNAGSNVTITLPASSVSLDGSASTGSIAQYYWYQASGPVSSVIGNMFSSITSATGLTTAGTYVFGLQVKNSSGATAYSYKTVTVNPAVTGSVPACVTNTSPANASTLTTQTTATLTWPSSATATSYDVYLAAGTGIPATLVTNTASLTYSASSLTAGTTYSWYIAPRNASGPATACGGTNKTTFTTAVAGTVPACVINTSPANASTLTTQTTATLTWPSSATATSYDVYLAAGTGIPATLVTNTASLTYSASSLTAGTTYSWYIAPRNASGVNTTCGSTNKTLFTTAVAGNQPLASNAGSNVTIVLPTSSVALDGSASTGNIAQYFWYQASGPVNSAIANNLSSVTMASGLTTAGTYVFGLQVKDNVGGIAYSYKTVIVSAAGTGPAPACVTNTSPANGTTIGTQTTATLTWPASSNATVYDVYLAAGTGIPTTLVANTAALSYIASGLIAGTTYSWYIAPRNATGAATTCGTTNKTTFTTAGTQPLASNAGSNVTIILPTSSVALDGSASTGSIAQYYWYQASGPVTSAIGNSFTSVTSATGLTTAGTYVFGLQVKNSSGTTAYSYKTVTVKPAGSSATEPVAHTAAVENSSLPSVTAVINPNPVVTGKQAKLQINSNKAGTVMVNIVSGNGSIIGTKKVNLITGINTTTVSIAGLAQGFHIISISGAAKPLNIKLIIQ